MIRCAGPRRGASQKVEQERLDLLVRDYRQREQDSHTKDALYQLEACSTTNNKAQFAIESLISTAQATTLAEAAVQTMLAYAHIDILRQEAREESGAAELAVASRRMLPSALLVMAREAGIDLTDFGGDFYASSPYCSWPTSELTAVQ